MISALYNGMSGLGSFQKALNTQSNNIANINTVAYKTDRISFVDMMYQNRMGKGTATVEVQKNFKEGDYKLTNNPYDLAIEGTGYFVVYDPEQDEIYYSRAGDFKKSVDGFLVTQTGEHVRGIPAAVTGDMIMNEDFPNFMASQIIKSATSVQSVNVRATDYNTSATDEIDPVTGIKTKTSSAIIADIELLKADYRKKLQAYANNPTNAGTAPTNQVTAVTVADYAIQLNDVNDSVSVTVNNMKYTQNFEEDAETTMQLLAAQIAKTEGVKDASFDPATGTITVDTLIPGENIKINSLMVNDTAYTSIATTAAVTGSGEAAMNSSYAALEAAMTRANAELTQVVTDITIPPKGTATTEVAVDVNGYGDLQLNLTELGISDNQFSDFMVDDGIIYMVQGDNKYAIAKIPTVAFNNEDGLLPEGGRLFKGTKDAGEPINADYGSKVVGKTLELSNSNMGESLVELMTFQRAYEANSRSITTADEFLNIAIQLKK